MLTQLFWRPGHGGSTNCTGSYRTYRSGCPPSHYATWSMTGWLPAMCFRPSRRAWRMGCHPSGNRSWCRWPPWPRRRTITTQPSANLASVLMKRSQRRPSRHEMMPPHGNVQTYPSSVRQPVLPHTKCDDDTSRGPITYNRPAELGGHTPGDQLAAESPVGRFDNGRPATFSPDQNYIWIL